MISADDKANAIAQIIHDVPLEDIASNTDIPLMVIKEWRENVSPTETIAIESHIHAVDRVVSGSLMPVNEDVLKNTLETTAIKLAKLLDLPARDGDVMAAQSMKLCAEAIAKLYSTLVLKGNSVVTVTEPQGSGLSSFESLMKD